MQQKLGAIDDASLVEKAEELETEMGTLDGWQLESEAREILHHLQVKDLDLPMNQLSGGMLRKVSLARLLLEENNLLLLDEPTHHLDVHSIAWLEDYLLKLKKAIILITHDRYFLDNVADHILEIDNQRLHKYSGNYSVYLEKKAAISEIEERTVAKHNNILRKELEWLGRMPRARGTKQKARIDQIEMRQQAVESMKKPVEMAGMYSADERLGKKILEIINVEKGFDGVQVIHPFSYEFVKKERIAIIGENGTGKTTFLKMIMQQISPDKGKVIAGVNTKIGYLSQISDEVDENLSVMNAVKEISNYIEFEDKKKLTAAQLLDKFLFTGSMQYQKVNRLSGGERRRLDIIRILMTNPNFLILDEPTNDLDLQTLNILEDYLGDFPGCLIVVSHDRYFLDKLTSKILVFKRNEPIEIVFGMVSDYLFQQKAPVKESKPGKSRQKEDKPKPQKLSYKLKLRKESIEKEIPVLEDTLKGLEKKLASGETDPELLEKWGKSHSATEIELMNLLEELDSIEAG